MMVKRVSDTLSPEQKEGIKRLNKLIPTAHNIFERPKEDLSTLQEHAAKIRQLTEKTRNLRAELRRLKKEKRNDD